MSCSKCDTYNVAWSIGASVGFSRAMVNLVLHERESDTSSDPPEGRDDGADLRMQRRILYGVLYADQMTAVTFTDQLWYSNIVDAKISLKCDVKVTLKITDPVVLVHRKGLIVFAHCGYTPSFYLEFDKSRYSSLGSYTLQIATKSCRSFTDPEKIHPSVVYLTTLPEDIQLLTAILDHCFRLSLIHI